MEHAHLGLLSSKTNKKIFFKDINLQGQRRQREDCSDESRRAGHGQVVTTWAGQGSKNPKPMGEKLRMDPIPPQSSQCAQELTARVPLEPGIRVEIGRPVKQRGPQVLSQLRSAGHLPSPSGWGLELYSLQKVRQRREGRDSFSARPPSGSPSQPRPLRTSTNLAPEVGGQKRTLWTFDHPKGKT